MFKNKSLAFKHSFYILTCTLIIFMAIFLHNSIVSRKLMLKNLQENSKIWRREPPTGWIRFS